MAVLDGRTSTFIGASAASVNLASCVRQNSSRGLAGRWEWSQSSHCPERHSAWPQHHDSYWGQHEWQINAHAQCHGSGSAGEYWSAGPVCPSNRASGASSTTKCISECSRGECRGDGMVLIWCLGLCEVCNADHQSCHHHVKADTLEALRKHVHLNFCPSLRVQA